MKRKFQKAFGYSFRNPKILKAALTHPSFQEEANAQELNFQRFEFLGDSILNSFIAHQLYELFPDANEGTLSRLRSVLVCRKLLAQIASKLHLEKYLYLGAQERKQFKIFYEKIMADSFEALIAAIYLDQGTVRVDQFLAKCFKTYLNQKKLTAFQPHPKSLLQEFSQKELKILPIYETKEERLGKFVSSVKIDETMKAKGRGKTKSEAEAQAAGKLIKKLKVKFS